MIFSLPQGALNPTTPSAFWSGSTNSPAAGQLLGALLPAQSNQGPVGGILGAAGSGHHSAGLLGSFSQGASWLTGGVGNTQRPSAQVGGNYGHGANVGEGSASVSQGSNLGSGSWTQNGNVGSQGTSSQGSGPITPIGNVGTITSGLPLAMGSGSSWLTGGVPSISSIPQVNNLGSVQQNTTGGFGSNLGSGMLGAFLPQGSHSQSLGALIQTGNAGSITSGVHQSLGSAAGSSWLAGVPAVSWSGGHHNVFFPSSTNAPPAATTVPPLSSSLENPSNSINSGGSIFSRPNFGLLPNRPSLFAGFNRPNSVIWKPAPSGSSVGIPFSTTTPASTTSQETSTTKTTTTATFVRPPHPINPVYSPSGSNALPSSHGTNVFLSPIGAPANLPAIHHGNVPSPFFSNLGSYQLSGSNKPSPVQSSGGTYLINPANSPNGLNVLSSDHGGSIFSLPNGGLQLNPADYSLTDVANLGPVKPQHLLTNFNNAKPPAKSPAKIPSNYGQKPASSLHNTFTLLQSVNQQLAADISSALNLPEYSLDRYRPAYDHLQRPLASSANNLLRRCVWCPPPAAKDQHVRSRY